MHSKRFGVEEDIYYLYLNREYNKVFSKSENSIVRLAKLVAYFAYFSVLCLLNALRKVNAKKIKASKFDTQLAMPLWFYIDSRNNYLTVDFIYEKYKNQSVYVSYKSAKFTDNKVLLKDINTYAPGLRCVAFLYHVIIDSKFNIGSGVISLIYRTFHLHDFYRALLALHKPKAIFFSNDHTPTSRSLLLAANELKVKTIFLQHASMSLFFPPLKFSLSLLDGQHSLDLYKQISEITGTYKTVGISRFDIKEQYLNKSDTIKTLGLAYNFHDELHIIENIIQLILSRFPDLTLYLRKHPRDERNIINLEKYPQLLESDSKTESSFEFLQKVDMLIANNSSILLEAAILNVLPVQYNLTTHQQIDYYGFIRNNLAKEAKSDAELMNLIGKGRKATMEYRSNAKYYDSSIGENYEFCVREEVLKLVDMYVHSDVS